jgi:ActR/RegA family two-component response regulator
MTNRVQLDGLLLTKDRQVVSMMNQILDNFAINTEVCGELEAALEAVSHRRLDAIIVDWDGTTDPTRIVRATRKSSPNSDAIIVAMVSAGSETHALLVGAHFMIPKPADLDHANRCMRAAYGTMLQNRRRAARVSVDLSALVRVGDTGGINGRISDLSVGGLALWCKQPLTIGQHVLAQFSMPGFEGVIHISGKVVNANAAGRAGVKFSFLPEEDRNALESWLAVELAKLESVEMPAAHATRYN